MTTSSESVGTEMFYFPCPHCKKPIRFGVDALQESDFEDDYDYDEAWDDTEEQIRKKEREEWEPYFESINEMADLIYGRQYAEAVPVIHATLDHMERLNAKESIYFSFWNSSFVFMEGARSLAFMGDAEGLTRILEIAQSVPNSRQSLIFDIKKRQRELGMFKSIREVIRDNPNCLQTDVKILINEVDGHHVAALLAYMDKASEIVRVREGRKIRISLASTSN